MRDPHEKDCMMNASIYCPAVVAAVVWEPSTVISMSVRLRIMRT
jgi:hypothetical protein